VSGDGAKMEQTLAIVKPDGVARGLMGEVLRRIEKENLRIVAVKMIRMDRFKAEGFYYVHRHRPFFTELVSYMTSGPALLLVLEGLNVIEHWRKMMGNTDPVKADPGTIRADFGSNIERNVVHGSDSRDSATFEINYFFSGTEIIC